ncbi:kinase-like protein [Pluteus cervinus]|uniref:Kinase-like protein n=1 Tax=Pluteus cervinus TaxID=181527 RepID=A0ACD3B8Y4_9AGAR|nr:kinase-like protein [Pluteus cervinus]
MASTQTHTGETQATPEIAPKPQSALERLNAILRRGAALTVPEFFWRDLVPWLETKGYKLRPRYQAGWEPVIPMSRLVAPLHEDYLPMARAAIADAIRIKDGKRVLLKRVRKSDYPHELEITRYFNMETLASDPHNHCVRLEETLDVPDDSNITIAVFPFLQQLVGLRFDTVGEIIDFLQQIFTGLQFMHQHHVAHRDINADNIMMDGDEMFPKGWNHNFPELTPDGKKRVKAFTRTQKPPKYYLIDFGLSRQYDASETNPLEAPIMGGDRTVPEFKTGKELVNPFHTDIYYIGNMIREYIIEGTEIEFKGHFETDFLKPLVADMVQDDPVKRPTIDEVVTRFQEICKEQTSWKLRSRPAPRRRENIFKAIPHQLGHWTRRIGYIARRIHPIPSRSPPK